MKINLIAHASVIIEINNIKILTDPWFSGRIFNDAWELYPEPKVDLAEVEKVDYLWISHEHSDHLHFPTLRSFSDEFKSRVTVLFQEKHSDRVISVIRKMGFNKIQTMHHRKIYELRENVKVYCYQVGHIDSTFAVFNDKETLVNINDCTFSEDDCNILKSDIGPDIDIVLNQFSIAHYPGWHERDAIARSMCQIKLNELVKNHKALGAKYTIPFASFVSFCCEDNLWLNEYANKVTDVYNLLGEESLIMHYGDIFDTSSPSHNNPVAVKAYEKIYSEAVNLSWYKSPFSPTSVDMQSLSEKFSFFCKDIHSKYYFWMLYFLEPLYIYLNDLNLVLMYDLRRKFIKKYVGNIKPDIEMHSQCLKFAFSFDWGFQTLTVGARTIILRNQSKWNRHRLFYTLRQGEIFMKLRYILTTKTLRHILDRTLFGFPLNQVIYKIKRVDPDKAYGLIRII